MSLNSAQPLVCQHRPDPGKLFEQCGEPAGTRGAVALGPVHVERQTDNGKRGAELFYFGGCFFGRVLQSAHLYGPHIARKHAARVAYGKSHARVAEIDADNYHKKISFLFRTHF